MKMKLIIRGRVVTVGTHDECLLALLRGWGWVPLSMASLLGVELEECRA